MTKARPGPKPSGIARLPAALRWATALVASACAVLAPAAMLPAVAAVELGLYAGAALGARAMWRDIRPLLWHIPFLVLATILVTGGLPVWKTLATSARIVLTALPLLWLHRVATASELLHTVAPLLPVRLRLILLFSLRIVPVLRGELADIRLAQALSGVLPHAARDWRPRHVRRVVSSLAVPIAVRAVRLTDDTGDAIEGRGLDEL